MDFIDGSSQLLAFVAARHKSFPVSWQPPGCASSGEIKLEGLISEEIAKIVLHDWQPKSGKGYYITGKLSKQIYRDDCYFEGPDPDMPVRGLRKYLSASSQLFDRKQSRADIYSLSFDNSEGTVTVKWRLEGALNLPWHPKLKPWTGTTTYFLDSSGLVEKHVEEWDISAIDAFLSTLFPSIYQGSPAAPEIV
jgi:hypothetical protein